MLSALVVLQWSSFKIILLKCELVTALKIVFPITNPLADLNVNAFRFLIVKV